MIKLLGAAVLTAAAVLGIQSLSLGDSAGDPRVPAKAESPVPRAAHRVATPSASTDALLRRAGARIKYFETDTFTVPGDGRDDSSVRCPRGHAAIDGYFGTSGGIVPDFMSIMNSPRTFGFGLIDLTGADGEAFLGIICYRR